MVALVEHSRQRAPARLVPGAYVGKHFDQAVHQKTRDAQVQYLFALGEFMQYAHGRRHAQASACDPVCQEIVREATMYAALALSLPHQRQSSTTCSTRYTQKLTCKTSMPMILKSRNGGVQRPAIDARAGGWLLILKSRSRSARRCDSRACTR